MTRQAETAVAVPTRFLVTDGTVAGSQVGISTAAQVRTVLNVEDGATANAGTVTSVAVSGSDGIEVDSGSPVTTSGTVALGVNAATLRAHINVADGATANAGTVTSVAVSGSDGIEIDSGSPVTASGTIALGVHAANMVTHLGAVTTAGAQLVSAQANNDLTTNPKFWRGTQAEYDALTPTAGEIYFILEA